MKQEQDVIILQNDDKLFLYDLILTIPNMLFFQLSKMLFF